jgi:acetolactate synthase I/II/III large subunit
MATRLLGQPTGVPEAIVRVLVEAGIDVVFGMSGGNTGRLFAALAHHTESIRTVLVRHESAAVIAAQAYGRLTGRPGVAIGQGAWLLTNGGAGTLEAFLGGSPVVLLGDLTDGSPLSLHAPYQSGTGEWGSWNARASFSGITKLVMAPDEPAQAVQSVQLAIKHALAHERGPVAVLFHSSALRGTVGVDSRPALYNTSDYLRPSVASIPDMREIARVVRAARQPVLIAGGGAQGSDSRHELLLLADEESIPVVSTAAGKGSFPEDHALSGGVFGNFGWPVANQTVGSADVVIAVGTKLTPSDTAGENPQLLDPVRQQLIQIDIEPRNASWTFPATNVVHAEAGLALHALRQELVRLPPEKNRITARRAVFAAAIGAQARSLPMGRAKDAPLHPQRVILGVRRALPDDAIVCVDAGENRLLMGRYFESREGGQYLQPSAAGAMGYAIPAALAAKVVHPDRMVVAVCGDGGFAMSMMGLLTAVEEEVPIVVVVMNNRALGWVKHGQIERDEAIFKSVLHDFDLAAVARAMGCHAERVEEPSSLGPALERALACGRPAVVDVVTSTAETFVDLRSPLVAAPARS